MANGRNTAVWETAILLHRGVGDGHPPRPAFASVISTDILQQHGMNCKRHGLIFQVLSLFVVAGPSFLLRKRTWAAVRPQNIPAPPG